MTPTHSIRTSTRVVYLGSLCEWKFSLVVSSYANSFGYCAKILRYAPLTLCGHYSTMEVHLILFVVLKALKSDEKTQ